MKKEQPQARLSQEGKRVWQALQRYQRQHPDSPSLKKRNLYHHWYKLILIPFRAPLHL
jgi:hypothetical protein